MAPQQAHAQQIETGRQIVKEILGKLAADLNRPEINNLSFMVTDKDFDHRQVSILDQNQKKIVMKVNDNDLADCPADRSVRRKLEAGLLAAVKEYYKI
jgi:hypothetical protein